LTFARNLNVGVNLESSGQAERRNLIYQFMGESLLLTLISLIIAFAFVFILLPAFASFTGKPIAAFSIFNPTIVYSIGFVTLLTGLISGSYPALFLSSFNPSQILKGDLTSGNRGNLFRKILVVAQFSLSITLIIYSLIQKDQINFMLEKDLGYNKKNIVFFRMPDQIRENPGSLKNELLSYPEFKNVTVSSRTPDGIYQNGSGLQWEGKDENIDPLVTYLSVDSDFMNTLSIEIKDGLKSQFPRSLRTSEIIIPEVGIIKDTSAKN